MTSIFDKLDEAADSARSLGESNEKMARGIEYASDCVRSRYNELCAVLRKAKKRAEREPLDAQERAQQTEDYGVVLGLEMALKIFEEGENHG